MHASHTLHASHSERGWAQQSHLEAADVEVIGPLDADVNAALLQAAARLLLHRLKHHERRNVLHERHALACSVHR